MRVVVVGINLIVDFNCHYCYYIVYSIVVYVCYLYIVFKFYGCDKMIYLDYSSTTPVSKDLLDLYVSISKNYIGNSNSKHFLGKKSSKLLEQAMFDVAREFDCHSKEIIFTSGASESNTMAIMGTVGILGKRGKHIITSKLEHKSILDLMKYLASIGYNVEYVNILSNGMIDLNDFELKLSDDTILVSICGVNSEVGFIQPLDEIRKILDKKGVRCFFHSDLTQALGKIKIDLSSVDMASFSSHKIYAPIGCGILYKKRTIQINKLIYGSSSNCAYRGGTPALPLIVTFAKAIQIAQENLLNNYNRCVMLKKILVQGLSKYPVVINSNDLCVSQIINLSLLECSNKEFVSRLSDEGICLSTNSACCGDNEESIILNEITNNNKKISSTSIRISISHLTTKEEIYEFLRIFDLIWNDLKIKIVRREN